VAGRSGELWEGMREWLGVTRKASEKTRKGMRECECKQKGAGEISRALLFFVFMEMAEEP